MYLDLDAVSSAEELRRVPGIIAAWRNPGTYGQFTLQDIDGDLMPECFGVKAGRDNGSGYTDKGTAEAVASDGMSMLWSSAFHRATNSDNHLWCKDLDGDGSFELIQVGRDLDILDAHSGRLKVRVPLKETEDSELPWSVGRLQDTSMYDVVICGSAPENRIVIRAFQYDGTELWSYHMEGLPGGNLVKCADIDGDGFDEVLYSSNSGLVVLEEDGHEKYVFAHGQRHSDDIVVDDLNEDGHLEACVQQPGCSRRGPISILDAKTGRLLSQTPDADPPGHLQMFVSGEFRPDVPGREVVFALRQIDGQTVRMLDHQGTPVSYGGVAWLQGDLYAEHVAAADTDGDGRDEILVTSGLRGLKGAHIAIFDGEDGRRSLLIRLKPDTVYACLDHVNLQTFDVNRNGRQEIVVQTPKWILLVETPETD